MRVVAPSAASFSGAASRAGPRLPGLDGLRGLAVASVLAFHLWPEAVRGGWLAVGLFFTLSGYLIARILDIEVTTTGRLRLGRFMARRTRRLLPAALVTIAGTFALSALMGHQPLRTIGVDALTAVLNVFNWHAATDEAGYTGIFDVTPEPLAHFWSLAIEEQFYLVFPAAVVLTRRTGRVVAAMAAIGLAGVWLWWGSTDAYVATPVRALEIAAGAGLAVAQARCRAVSRLFEPSAGLPRPSRIAWGAVLTAVAALTATAVFRFDADHGFVFRGGPQMMALCWVVLVIAAARVGPFARALSWAPLRWLGLRSYAVYLFHWPLIELTDWHPVVVIAATLGLAEVSFHVLEMPVRRRAGRLAVPVLAAAAVTLAAVAAVAAISSQPVRGFAERAAQADELPDWLTEQGATSSAVPAAEPARDPASEPETGFEPPIVTVLGDSAALYIADGLREWGNASRLMAVVDHSSIGCSPAGTAGSRWRRLRDNLNGEAHLMGFAEDGACRHDPIGAGSNVVLVVDHAAVLLDHQSAEGQWTSILDPGLASDVADSYRRLVDNARDAGARVVFTTAPRLLPTPGQDAAEQPQTNPERAEAYNALIRGLVNEFNAVEGVAAVGLIDFAPLLDEHGYEGAYGRSDGMHIDYDRAEAFAAEILGPALLTLLGLGYPA